MRRILAAFTVLAVLAMAAGALAATAASPHAKPRPSHPRRHHPRRHHHHAPRHRHRHRHGGGGGTHGGGGGPCALTHAAGANPVSSCWATHTGVASGTGFTEAQIEAGQSTLTHVTGDLTITKAGTTVSDEWISGCIAIDASHVTIKDSLITPNGDSCSGGNHSSASSAINDGDVGSGSSPIGTLIEDVTVDAGPSQGPGTAGDTYGVFLSSGECLRCVSFGFAKDFWLDGTASAPALLQDSYAPSIESCTPVATCTHMDAVFLDSSTYVTLAHSYIYAYAPTRGNTTAAVDGQADWGPIDHVKLSDSYVEGADGVDVEWSCAATNSAITNTAFSNDSKFPSAPIDYYNTNPGDAWSANYIAETGAAFRDPTPDC